MTLAEAQKNLRNFYDITNPTEEDQFLYTESLEFLISKTNESQYMMQLGGHYYQLQDFDLALKYYDMAALKNDESAFECLGYIWYYGRTGVKDYKKAFENFEKAMKLGNIVATYKVADMYKNGYYVEKDYDKYKEIIEDLYTKVKDDRNVFSSLPEIFTRLAKIRMEDKKNEEARKLLEKARHYLEERIHYNPFFGNFTIMKWLIKDLYTVKEFDYDNVEFYDLYYVLSKPAKVTFDYINDSYEVESVEEDGELVIKCGDKWYRTIDDFMQKAEIDGERLSYIYYELEDFEVLSCEK